MITDNKVTFACNRGDRQIISDAKKHAKKNLVMVKNKSIEKLILVLNYHEVTFVINPIVSDT